MDSGQGGDLRSTEGPDAGPFTAGVWLAMALAVLAIAAIAVALLVWRVVDGEWLRAAFTLVQAGFFLSWGVVLLRRWRQVRDARGAGRREEDPA